MNNEIKKVPQKYETTDGEEFLVEDEATRHQRFLDARREFEQARDIFKVAWAKSQKTADGKMFEFGVLRDYYYIKSNFNRLPYLRTIHFYGFDFDIRQEDDVQIGIEKNGERQWIAINRLYVDRGEAEKSLLKAQQEQLAEYQKEIEEFKKKVEKEDLR